MSTIMSPLKLVKGPHLLFVGANGRKTYGITIEATGPREDVELKGYRRTLYYNDYTISHSAPSSLAATLGITPEEAEAIQREIKRLVQSQTGE